MKKFIGYYIIGAANKEEAKLEKGMMLWSQTKPSAIKRLFNRVLLGIYWIDRERVLEKKQDGHRENLNQHTEMPRYRPAKRIRTNDTVK